LNLCKNNEQFIINSAAVVGRLKEISQQHKALDVVVIVTDNPTNPNCLTTQDKTKDVYFPNIF